MNTSFARHYGAHRYYNEQRYGPMPKEHITHHKCEVKQCVNPDHTVTLSKTDNRIVHAVLDMNDEKAEAISVLRANDFDIEAICRLFNLTRAVVEALPTTSARGRHNH
jgi:hypothetical protein